MELWQADIKNVIAPMGSSLSPEQEKLIVDAVGKNGKVALMGSSLSPEQEALIVDAVGKSGKIALMFDEDEAGWKCREDALTRFAPQVYVKIIGLGAEGAQPDSLSEEEIQKLGLLDGE